MKVVLSEPNDLHAKMKNLSLSAVRTLHLAAQGMLTPLRRKARKEDVLTAIRRMAHLQIDTINVVAKSPYLVLFSRIGSYQIEWLTELLAEGKLFEYWSHEACFVPIEDYRLLRHRMLNPTEMGWKYASDWHLTHRNAINLLLRKIREFGPVRSTDFVNTEGAAGGWWNWKPEKRHLEVLFTTGELMVSERKNFQRVYDLRERVHPGWSDTRDLPTLESAHLQLLSQACRSLGVVRADWVADYYRIQRRSYKNELYALADQGEIIPVGVDGWKEDVFVHNSVERLIDIAQSGKLVSTVTSLLSPFDPIVWDRKRTLALFGFDYAIECYVPKANRKYGYFCLPILYRGRLVGRIDAKAHRLAGVFELKSIHLEDKIRVTENLASDLSRVIRRCANWHQTPRISIGAAPVALVEKLKPWLNMILVDE